MSRDTICDGNTCDGCAEDHGWTTGVGFKCLRDDRNCILPQQLVWDGIPDCDGGADLCFSPEQRNVRITGYTDLLGKNGHQRFSTFVRVTDPIKNLVKAMHTSTCTKYFAYIEFSVLNKYINSVQKPHYNNLTPTESLTLTEPLGVHGEPLIYIVLRFLLICDKFCRDFRNLSTSIFDEDMCFQCLHDDTIIPKNSVCDGVFDCPDMSDECLCNEAPGICGKVVR